MNKFKKMFKQSFMNLPTPINISYWWNFGSLLGLFLFIQIISGLLISMHYCPNLNLAFYSIIHIIQNVNYGWFLHNIHMNGASFFFLMMYLHIGRNLYYNSFKLFYTWTIGISIFFIAMATASLGYMLPWGQMSFWGATVITNLLSAIPFIGTLIVNWIWGGFSINNATLNRFYSLHFILPLFIFIMVLMHLYFLHETGSSNPLGLNSNLNKISFHIYFTFKDIYMIFIILLLFFTIILQYPYILSDPDNFINANPMITPIHIKPEWYFLFAYAILRSIPSKLGGVIALLSSILILYFIPMMNYMMLNSPIYYPMNKFSLWYFINTFLLLTWLGAQPIEFPFLELSQILSIIYFFFYLSMNFFFNMWDLILFYKTN